jgi:hypothetical protein
MENNRLNAAKSETATERENEMKNILLMFTFAVILSLGIISGPMAGGNYHGHGMGMSEMTDMDSNDDGAITFEEFKAPTIERLKSGFDMLDTDNDGEIDQTEWDNYLRIHGYEVSSDS